MRIQRRFATEPSLKVYFFFNFSALAFSFPFIFTLIFPLLSLLTHIVHRPPLTPPYRLRRATALSSPVTAPSSPTTAPSSPATAPSSLGPRATCPNVARRAPLRRHAPRTCANAVCAHAARDLLVAPFVNKVPTGTREFLFSFVSLFRLVYFYLLFNYILNIINYILKVLFWVRYWFYILNALSLSPRVSDLRQSEFRF